MQQKIYPAKCSSKDAVLLNAKVSCSSAALLGSKASKEQICPAQGSSTAAAVLLAVALLKCCSEEILQSYHAVLPKCKAFLLIAETNLSGSVMQQT